MSPRIPQEGVIQFEAHHQDCGLSPRRFGELACRLTAWRAILVHTQLLGRDQQRYEGVGFGNLSGRVGAPSSARGLRSFLISGTQTSARFDVALDDFALVRSYDPRANLVESQGRVRPSSEAMTHGSIYDLSPRIRFVFHGHSPIIWQQRRLLQLPSTAEHVSYGTPEMASEVQRLYRETALPEGRLLAMGGHEDGVIAFGRSPEEAGEVLVSGLARAYERACRG